MERAAIGRLGSPVNGELAEADGVTGSRDRVAAAVHRTAWIVFVIAVATFLILWATQAWVAGVYLVPSASMEPTIRAGDRVVTNKLAYRVGAVERGDIVTFDATGYFEPPSNGESIFVKRVIGRGGDRVECCDETGSILVNGEPTEWGFPGSDGATFSVVVPDAHLWLMGDNRSESADSRNYLGRPGGGFVPESRVTGRVVMSMWPLQGISSAGEIGSGSSVAPGTLRVSQ